MDAMVPKRTPEELFSWLKERRHVDEDALGRRNLTAALRDASACAGASTMDAKLSEGSMP